MAMTSAPLSGLRPYQVEAVRSILGQLRDVRSTLLVMATGTGKTQVFCGLASLARGRVLVLAHRDELVSQAANRIEAMTGELAGVEKAELHSQGLERFVVGSVQTLRRKRIEALPRDSFSLVVVDEAHHCSAVSYRRIIDWFEPAKVLGVTATPDRTDRQALGEIFESVAYEYGTWQAITDGWLVPPSVLRVVIDSVDLSGVATVAGDLAPGQLDEQMGTEQALHGVATPLLEHAGDRKTLVFLPGVASAHGLADVLNARRPGCARALDGTTPLDTRRRMLSDHADGAYQYLANCMVLTEGFDSPEVSCIAMARPTKSRSLYAQILGRGLRTATGKTDCLVLDYTDSSRRLDLAGPEDVLGQADSDDVTEEARKIVRSDPGERIELCEALIRARATVQYRIEQEELRRSRTTSGRKTVSLDVAWRLFGLDPERLRTGIRYSAGLATRDQTEQLLRLGIEPGELDRRGAQEAIQVMVGRQRARLATPAQVRLLTRRKYTDAASVTMVEARAMIDSIAARGWRT